MKPAKVAWRYVRRFHRLLLLVLGLGFCIYLLFTDDVATRSTHETTWPSPNQTRPALHSLPHAPTCIHPELRPFHPSLLPFLRKVPPHACSSNSDWVHVAGSEIRVTSDALHRYGNVRCTCRPLVRQSDFANDYGPAVDFVNGSLFLPYDFCRVDCVSSGGLSYHNLHAGVASKPEVLQRLQSHADRATPKPNRLPDDDDNNKIHFPSTTNPSPFDKVKDDQRVPVGSRDGLGLSVFMFGFDSMSRQSWLRTLPKTRRYFVESLQGIELERHNVVGEGTPAALLPILTGHSEQELPEARKGFPGAQTVDGHPWLWKRFSRAGYVTAWAEDLVSSGAFTYRMMGFQRPPTDHYWHPFQLAVDTRGRDKNLDNNYFCAGSKPLHIVFMNWFRDLFDAYTKFPKFFFGFYARNSHGNNNLMTAIDGDVVDFLRRLQESGHLNRTLLILMGDHGSRFGPFQATRQGRLEARLPYFGFRFPPWFVRKHPDAIANLRTNARRLTTPFDIHETLVDVLQPGAGQAGSQQHRGVSLFTEISPNRTCSHAAISPHWCACLDWRPVDLSRPVVAKAVEESIRMINSQTADVRTRCARLRLFNITSSARYVCSDQDERAQRKVTDYHKAGKSTVQRYNGVTCDQGTILFKLSFVTDPGRGHFDVVSSYDSLSDTFRLSNKDISRINAYGSQPGCIAKSKPHLRPYCYCV